MDGKPEKPNRGIMLTGGVAGAAGHMLFMAIQVSNDEPGTKYLPGLSLVFPCTMILGFLVGSGLGAFFGMIRSSLNANRQAKRTIVRLRAGQ